jgi:hypothetical protein
LIYYDINSAGWLKELDPKNDSSTFLAFLEGEKISKLSSSFRTS